MSKDNEPDLEIGSNITPSKKIQTSDKFLIMSSMNRLDAHTSNLQHDTYSSRPNSPDFNVYPGHNSDGTKLSEESWSESMERLIMDWRSQLSDMANLHEEAGIKIKGRNHKFSVLIFIVPTFMSFIQTIFSLYNYDGSGPSSSSIITLNETSLTYSCNGGQTYGSNVAISAVNASMFFVTGVLNKFYTEFDLANLYTLHFQFAARYNDLVNRIDTEMSRRRKYRVVADVFITELRCQIENLNQNSPDFESMCLS